MNGCIPSSSKLHRMEPYVSAHPQSEQDCVITGSIVLRRKGTFHKSNLVFGDQISLVLLQDISCPIYSSGHETVQGNAVNY